MGSIRVNIGLNTRESGLVNRYEARNAEGDGPRRGRHRRVSLRQQDIYVNAGGWQRTPTPPRVLVRFDKCNAGRAREQTVHACISGHGPRAWTYDSMASAHCSVGWCVRGHVSLREREREKSDPGGPRAVNQGFRMWYVHVLERGPIATRVPPIPVSIFPRSIRAPRSCSFRKTYRSTGYVRTYVHVRTVR